MIEYLMPADMNAEWHAGRGKPMYEMYGEDQACKGVQGKIQARHPI